MQWYLSTFKIRIYLFIRVILFSTWSDTLALVLKCFRNLSMSPFYPRPVLAFGYCHHLCLGLCVHVCVSIKLRGCPHRNSSHVQASITKFWSYVQITLFKMQIGLGAGVVGGAIGFDLQGQIWLKSPSLPHIELVRTITYHLLKLESSNLDQWCKTHRLRSLVFAVDLFFYETCLRCFCIILVLQRKYKVPLMIHFC